MRHDAFTYATLPQSCLWHVSRIFAATHCNTLQHTATHTCSMTHVCMQRGMSLAYLWHDSFICVTCLAFVVAVPGMLPKNRMSPTLYCNALEHNTLQRTATQCNALQNNATHRIALQRTVTHCNTLQHTATHCNTLSQWGVLCWR